MRVALIPTGRTEWHGLAKAFGHLFPRHEFFCLPTEKEVHSHPEDFPCRGVTTTPLTEKQEQLPTGTAEELIERAAQSALGTRREPAADLVVVVDDLELLNAAQPDRVVRMMRRAAELHLDRFQNAGVRDRTGAALRERVSFHLVVPMIEAWFFADPTALERAGVGAVVQFSPDRDPEDFVTDDQDYLSATEGACPRWCALPPGRRAKQRPKWLGALARDRHPKGYLQWLCRDPHAKSCTRYSETEGGASALKDLDWGCVLGRNRSHFAFLWAMVEDLEDALGCCSYEGERGSPAALTARSSLPPRPVLRNL